MPAIAAPSSNELTVFFRTADRGVTERSAKAIQSAASDAAMAIAIESTTSVGSYAIEGSISMASMPV